MFIVTDLVSLICTIDYPKFIVSKQKEESISIQRVKVRGIGGNNCKFFPKRSRILMYTLAIVT